MIGFRKTGGNRWGVGVVAKTNLKVKVHPHKDFTSFEYMEATLAASKAHVHVVIIYHSPPATKNKLAIPLFMATF